MSKTHWRKILESEYLAGSDLDDGNGNFNPITATIKCAKSEEVLEPGTNRKEKCLVLYFQEKLKPMICNVTNSKAVKKVTGSDYIEDWAGKRITIRTEKVKAFGELWDALRISPVPPKSSEQPKPVTIPCADCGGEIKAVGGVPAEKILAGTQKSYGRPLCMDCANAAKKAATEIQAEEKQEEPIDEIDRI